MNAEKIGKFKGALAVVVTELTSAQRAMLQALLEAPNHRLSLLALADAAGFSSVNPVNTQLGRVGRRLVELTRLKPRFYDRQSGKPVLISVFAEWNNARTTYDDWAWSLLPEFVEALRAFGFTSDEASATDSNSIGKRPTLQRAAESLLEDLEAVDADLASLPETERHELRLARIGQGQFRSQLIVLWNGCSVTGLANPYFLRASHLKPWRVSSNSERLDPANGLLLLPNLDFCIDQGLLTFDDRGNALIAKRLTTEESAALGLRLDLKLRRVDAQLRPFLRYHREHVFDKPSVT